VALFIGGFIADYLNMLRSKGVESPIHYLVIVLGHVV